MAFCVGLCVAAIRVTVSRATVFASAGAKPAGYKKVCIAGSDLLLQMTVSSLDLHKGIRTDPSQPPPTLASQLASGAIATAVTW
jgi:hypothetical protein